MSENRQMSDSIYLAVILALSGGFMDAYSYIGRGGVFANAQTGNVLLFCVNLGQHQWADSLRYLIPIGAFMSGIAISDVSKICFGKMKAVHWRQITLLIEILIFFAVGFIGNAYDLLANSLISLACGIQVESFRKVDGTVSATTMCLGNLRGTTEYMVQYLHTKDKKAMKRSLLLFIIIGSFGMGAVLCDLLLDSLGMKSIWVCCVLLIISFAMMFFNGEKQAEKTGI